MGLAQAFHNYADNYWFLHSNLQVVNEDYNKLLDLARSEAKKGEFSIHFGEDVLPEYFRFYEGMRDYPSPWTKEQVEIMAARKQMLIDKFKKDKFKVEVKSYLISLDELVVSW